jgi:hypothetical protein
MRKQKGSIPEQVLFGELVQLSHQIRSVGCHRATPGMIRRQGGPGLARIRRFPQYGNNMTNANRVLPCVAPSRAVASSWRIDDRKLGWKPTLPSALLGDGGDVAVSKTPLNWDFRF